jgi:tetratricopeptide (TPR) repeat protein
MASQNGNDNDDLGAAFAVAGLAAVAAGIWALFKDSDKSNERTRFTQQQTEVQNAYDFAVACTQRGDFNQAIQLFFQILQRDANHAPTYNFLAWIYAIHNYQLDQALAFATKAVELANSPLEKAYYLDTVAEVHAHKGEFDRAAVISFEFLNTLKSFNQTPSSPVTYFRLAWCYQLNQDFNNAYGFLQQALQINNLGAGDYANAGDVCHAMGFICFQKELYHEAITHFNSAKSLYETSVNSAKSQGINDDLFLFKLSMILNDIGSAFYFLENYQNSWSSHQSAYSIFPSNPYPPINLALLSARQKNKQLMLYWLGIGIPLIVDIPPFLQSGHLISVIVNDIDFEVYRDDVLGLLLTHHKISSSDYKRFLKHWHGRQRQPTVFNQQNIYGSVGAAAGNVEGSFVSQPQGSDGGRMSS